MKKTPHIRGYRGAHTGLVSCSLGNSNETGDNRRFGDVDGFAVVAGRAY